MHHRDDQKDHRGITRANRKRCREPPPARLDEEDEPSEIKKASSLLGSRARAVDDDEEEDPVSFIKEGLTSKNRGSSNGDNGDDDDDITGSRSPRPIWDPFFSPSRRWPYSYAWMEATAQQQPQLSTQAWREESSATNKDTMAPVPLPPPKQQLDHHHHHHDEEEEDHQPKSSQFSSCNSYCPLIQDFYRALGKWPIEKDSTHNAGHSGVGVVVLDYDPNDNRQDKNMVDDDDQRNHPRASALVEADQTAESSLSAKQTRRTTAVMDDPQYSTLTKGQHERYLRLLQSSSSPHSHSSSYKLRRSSSSRPTTSSSSSWPSELADPEWPRLKKAVQQEQQRYHELVQQHFWGGPAQRTRLLTGFITQPNSSSSSARRLMTALANLAARNRHQQRQWYEKLTAVHDDHDDADGKEDTSPRHLSGKYGACRQILSLSNTNAVPGSSSSESKGSAFFFSAEHGIRCQALLESHLREMLPILPEFPPVGSVMGTMPPHRPATDQPPQAMEIVSWDGDQVDQLGGDLSIREDGTAWQWAEQHDANIIASLEAVEALLLSHLPTGWIIPAQRVQRPPASRIASTATPLSILLLEAPIPQVFASPRDALSRGVETALQNWLSSLSSHSAPRAISKSETELSESDVPDKRSGQNHLVKSKTDGRYRYALLEIPPPLSSSQKNKKALRIAVRASLRGIFKGQGNRHPGESEYTQVRARLEYFSERGMEIPNHQEWALLLLDYLLLPPNSTLTVASVDVSEAKVLAWREFSSRAHILAEIESTKEEKGGSSGLDMWKRLIHLLHAMHTIGLGEHIFCFPGRPQTSHTPATPFLDSSCISVHKADANGELALDEQWKDAGQVPLGPAALAQCYRRWVWTDASRAPYTFPPRAMGRA